MKRLQNEWMVCVTCGKQITTDEHGMSDDQPLYLRPVGGYSDFYDNYSDSEEEDHNLITFCHKCGHRIIRLMGKGVLRYVNPLSTTSHVRPDTDLPQAVSYWHFGWDNVTLRGYISAAFHYFRLRGFSGITYALRYLFHQQNFDNLNKSIKDPYPKKFNIGFIRIPKWYGIRIANKIKERGF
jgi:DNA-directed RNA polymerase subunit RPC12/RpoP